MKQILLVAGVDFEFHGVDFRSLADNRRALLERKNTKHDDLRFITMDVRSGQVEVRDITFPSGKRTETVASTTPFTPVTQASYGANAAGQVRLKPALYTVMSITDVYARVRDIGSKDPGTLVELSFFSHGWMGGPILANSNDDRLMTLMIPNPFGPATPMTVAVTGNARDPDDKTLVATSTSSPRPWTRRRSSSSRTRSPLTATPGSGDAPSRRSSITPSGRWSSRRTTRAPGSDRTSSCTCRP
jgi:hypothetical protein